MQIIPSRRNRIISQDCTVKPAMTKKKDKNYSEKNSLFKNSYDS